MSNCILKITLAANCIDFESQLISPPVQNLKFIPFSSLRASSKF